MQLPPSDAEIVAELLETKNVSNDNDDAIKTEDEPVYYPTKKEVLQFMETMQKYSKYLFSKDDTIVQILLLQSYDQHFMKKSRQTTNYRLFLEFVKKCFWKKKFGHSLIRKKCLATCVLKLTDVYCILIIYFNVFVLKIYLFLI